MWPEDTLQPPELTARLPPLRAAWQMKTPLLTGTLGHSHRICAWAQGCHAKVGNLFAFLKALRIALKNLADIKRMSKLTSVNANLFPTQSK